MESRESAFRKEQFAFRSYHYIFLSSHVRGVDLDGYLSSFLSHTATAST
jgi:hypothetical protein